jgi:hypothetical protein
MRILHPGYDDDLSLTTPDDVTRKNPFSTENFDFKARRPDFKARGF